MAAQIGSMFASLSLDLRPFSQGMKQAEVVTARSMGAIQTQAGLTTRAVAGFNRQISNRRIQPYSLIAATRAFEGANERVGLLRGSLIAATTAIGGFAAALSTSVILRYADSFTLLNNQLRVTARGAGDLEARLAALTDISHRSRSGLQDTTVLFSRLAKAQPNRDPEQLLRNVETIQKSLQLGGATVQEASSAAIQFSQAIASNRLGGEELRAVLETPLGLELARGLDVTIGKFREMAIAGELTADVLLESLDKAASRIDEQFANSVRTFDQAVKQADNRLTLYTGELDKSLGATRRMGDGVLFLADNLDTLVPTLAGLGGAFSAVFAGRMFQRGADKFITQPIAAVKGISEAAKASVRAAEEAADDLQKKITETNREIGRLTGQRAIAPAAAADRGLVSQFERDQAALEKLNKQKLDLLQEEENARSKLAGITAQTTGRTVKLTDQVIDSESRVNALLEEEKRLRNDLANVDKRLATTQSGRPVFSQQTINNATKERKGLESDIAKIQTNVARETERLGQRRLRLAESVGKAEHAAAQARIRATNDLIRIQREAATVEGQRVSQGFVVSGRAIGIEDSGKKNLDLQAREQAAGLVPLRTALVATQKELTTAEKAATGFARAGTAARAAWGSFVGFLGGPWGLAFVGAIGLMTALGIQSVKTAERARRVEGILDRVFEDRADQGQPEARPTLSFLRISEQIKQLKADAADLKDELEDAADSVKTSLFISAGEARDPENPFAPETGEVFKANELIEAFANGKGTIKEFRQEFQQLGEAIGLPQNEIDSISDAAFRYGLIARALKEVNAESATLEGRLPLASQRPGIRLRQEQPGPFSEAEGTVIGAVRDDEALTRISEREQKLAKARADLLAVFEKETGDITNATRAFVDEITLQSVNFQEAANTLSRLRGEAASLFSFDLGSTFKSEGLIRAADLSAIQSANQEITELERGAASYGDELKRLQGFDITTVLGFVPASSKAFGVFAKAKEDIDRLADGFSNGTVNAEEFAAGMESARANLAPFNKGGQLDPFIDGILKSVLAMELLGEQTDEERRKLQRLLDLMRQRDERAEDTAVRRAPTQVERGRSNIVLQEFRSEGVLSLLPEHQQSIERNFLQILDALNQRNAHIDRGVRDTARSVAAQMTSMERAKNTIADLVSRSDEIFAGLGGGNTRSLGSLGGNFGTQAIAFGEFTAFREELGLVTEALDVLRTQRDEFLAQPLAKALGGVDDIQMARSALGAVQAQLGVIFDEVSKGELNASRLSSQFEQMRASLLAAGGERTFVDQLISQAKELINVLGLAIARKQQLEQAGPKVQVSALLTEQQVTVPSQDGGTSGVTVTRGIIPTKNIADGTQAGVSGLTNVTKQGVTATNRFGSAIGQNTGDTVSGLRDVNGNLTDVNGNIVRLANRPINVNVTSDKNASLQGDNGIGSFTAAMSGAAFAKIALGSFTAVKEQQMAALSAEAQVLQTGLQFKNLSPEERKESELRLAEIQLQNAKITEELAMAQLSLLDATERLRSGFWSITTKNAGFDIGARAIGSKKAGQEAALTGQSFDPFRLLQNAMFMAGGGAIHGPGGPKSDKVPIMGSNGEFMMNAAATRKHRPILEAWNSGQDVSMLAGGGAVGRIHHLAGGGYVGKMPTMSMGSGIPEGLVQGMENAAAAMEKAASRQSQINVPVTIIADTPQAFQNSRAVIQRDISRGVRAGTGS